MKLIIDINNNEYMGIKEYPNNITSYPVTIHLYDAVRNGTPLDDLRDEIEKAVWEDVVGSLSLDGTDEIRIPRLNPTDVFAIIDRYK